MCLSGEGSDELFAGYDFYKYNLAIERLRGVLGGGIFRRLSQLSGRFGRFEKIRKYLSLGGLALEERYRGISSYDAGRKANVYRKDFAAHVEREPSSCKAFVDDLFSRSRGWDPLSRMLYFDMKTWLVDDLLIKADRMSMAASIELRVPFLDHRLVEYAATLPSRYKIRNGTTKYILKEVMRRKLPAGIVRRRKMGFPTPLEIMFREDLFDYARDTLSSVTARNRGYFDPCVVDRLLLDHRAGKAANHREIWQLLVLEEWHRRFMD